MKNHHSCRARSANNPTEGKLIFNRYGNSHFLAQVALKPPKAAQPKSP